MLNLPPPIHDRPTARWSAAVWLAAAVAIATALTLEFGFGFEPCHLCLFERLPYYAVLIVLPIAVGLRFPRIGLALAGILLLGDAALSAYHVAVEQGWAALPEACVSAGQARTLEELRAQLANAAPTCDQVSVTFLGLSLAAWNALYAAAAGLAGLVGAWVAPSASEEHR